MFKLYREPMPGEMVVIAADPAEGGDYCAAVAKSKKIMDTFMVFYAHIDSAQFGHELYKMAKFIYNKTGEWPWIAVERNTGQATINVLQTYNYPRLFRMPRAMGNVAQHGDEDKIGWHTNSLTRPKMLDELSLSLTQKSNSLFDEETILQLMAFVRNERTGRAEAAPGAHDDLVIAEAIALQVMGMAPATSKDSIHAKIAQFPHQDLFDDNGVPNY